MRTFVQLKDGVGFAVVNTEKETAGIEVEFGTGEQYLKKTYNNGQWEPAPLIWFAELNYDGSIIEICKTYFISEVGDAPILTPEIKQHFKYVDGVWIDPSPVVLPLPEVEINTTVNEQGEILNEEASGDTV